MVSDMATHNPRLMGRCKPYPYDSLDKGIWCPVSGTAGLLYHIMEQRYLELSQTVCTK